MKKLPLAILGTAALSIPVKAIAHDSDGLYGTPDSLSEQPPKIEESSLIRLPINTEQNLAISNHIQRMYSDPEYAQDYIYNIGNSIGTVSHNCQSCVYLHKDPKIVSALKENYEKYMPNVLMKYHANEFMSKRIS